MILLSHSGKQHSYHVAKALFNLSYLKKFVTSSYIRSPRLQRWVTNTGNQYFSRRFIEGLSGKKVDSNWRFELPEIIFRQLTGKSPKTQRAVYQRDINFDYYVAKNLNTWFSPNKSKIENRKSKIKTIPPFFPSINHSSFINKNFFWGFQGSCHSSLLRANELGISSITELATAHVTAAQKILGEEQRLLPHWADSIDNLVFPSFYEKRLKEEPHIAHMIISASDFTTQTLLDDKISKEKIIKLPLGFDLDYITPKEHLQTQSNTSSSSLKSKIENHQSTFKNRPIRLLYCGTVTQRKGIFYLLEAIKFFKKAEVELHIIGGIQGSGEAFQKYKNHFVYHPPVSQYEMFSLYKEYDALILPSIFEGFGLVIVEAMAAGLPVIATSHTMGPDVIEEGKNGYLIPIRDINSIKKSIGKMINLSEEEYNKMSVYARESVLKFTWAEYQNRLKNIIEQNLLKS